MAVLAKLAVGIVALLHLLFLVLEMFLWTRPQGMRIFGLDADFARKSATLAANQGLYNGFLAAGLIWGLFAGQAGYAIQLFFLACVIVAGVYGGLTVKPSILRVQALPGLVALIFVLLAG